MREEKEIERADISETKKKNRGRVLSDKIKDRKKGWRKLYGGRSLGRAPECEIHSRERGRKRKTNKRES